MLMPPRQTLFKENLFQRLQDRHRLLHNAVHNRFNDGCYGDYYRCYDGTDQWRGCVMRWLRYIQDHRGMHEMLEFNGDVAVVEINSFCERVSV